ncbi:hypothetical protein [Nonomuraea sp. NPDC050691]|uniref:hypothetical protein n=1 Tax=Nonomuraea sp. NPDC050691 TaxID=3155661 RepID=UPI0033CA7915
MAWTVLVPENEKISIPDLISRLELPGNCLQTGLIVGLPDVAYIDARNTCLALFEAEGFSHVGYAPNMERLAVDNSVWHVSWNITGRSMMRVAQNGHVQAEILDLDPSAAHGIGLDIVDDYLPLLRSASRRKWPALTATAMAIIEDVTGARLDQDWINQPQSGLSITRPPVGPEGSADE